MPSRAYEFCPLAAADLTLVGRWLAAPHVARWWGAPSAPLALVSGDLAEPSLDQSLVTLAGWPFGYLQCNDVSAWSCSGLVPPPRGSRGIDQFIGEPDTIGRGHGSAAGFAGHRAGDTADGRTLLMIRDSNRAIAA
jgi:aminoglycoside 6'-N-acetyltransferase